MGLDPAQVQRHLRAIATANNSDAQGKAYETLAVYLFESVPGCLVERDIISFFGTEQVDIAIGNPATADGLALLPAVVIVECKDWDRPVDSKTVGYFINLLAGRSAEVGILIAAHGITGDPHELSRAHALGVSALARGIKLLVITTQEIAALTCTADLVELINRRYLRAFAIGSIGIPG